VIKFSLAEKVIVRRVLREMHKAADTGLVSGFLHPDNGSKVTPSETLRSVAHLFASVWGIDISGIAVEPPVNPHREPRITPRLREKRNVKADQ
jgi:hypothetical protein